MQEVRQMRLFVASPSDVADELACITDVVAKINSEIGPTLGIRLDSWQWQMDAVPGQGDPQKRINEQLETADIVVVILWNRIGTPTPRALSGTVEEVERALGRTKDGWPRVMVYYCNRPSTLKTREDLEQRRAVLEFREKYSTRILAAEFSSAEEFRRRLYRDLLEVLRGESPPSGRGHALGEIAPDATRVTVETSAARDLDLGPARRRVLLPVLVILLLTLAVFAGSKYRQIQLNRPTSQLTIDSNVPDVSVFLNGRLMGKQQNLEVEPGRYQLLIEKKGYHDFETTLDLVGGQAHSVDATLIARLARLSIEDCASGCRLQIDGEPTALPSQGWIEIAPGHHRVVVEKRNYGRWQTEIQLEPGENETITPRFVAQLANLRIRSNVQSAAVLVDGTFLGVVEQDPFPIKPGRHAVRVQRDGYEPWEEMVDFKANATVVINTNLVDRTARLTFTGDVSGADLFVGDEQLAEGSLSTTVEPGKHRVKAIRHGYKSWQKDLDLAPGQEHRVEVKLVELGRWELAIKAIERSSNYGFTIAKQEGLLPIGENPVGLWEFWHIGSGSLPLETRRDERKGSLPLADEPIRLLLLPGGTFWQGAVATEATNGSHDPSAEADESFLRQVTIPPFFLAPFEMTQGQWERVTKPRNVPEDLGRDERLLLPVNNVSWNEARSILDAIGLRLPTEAEWEYAARANSTAPWSFGASYTQLKSYAWYSDNSENQLHPVGRKGANPFGLYDLYGNVGEWCHDAYADTYKHTPADGSAYDPPRSVLRVYRGGTYKQHWRASRSANRSKKAADYRFVDVGLRVARSVSLVRR